MIISHGVPRKKNFQMASADEMELYDAENFRNYLCMQFSCGEGQKKIFLNCSLNGKRICEDQFIPLCVGSSFLQTPFQMD